MKQENQYTEVLELAIAREVRAVQLFLGFAEYFADSDMAQIFIDVAKEEMRHKADLELEVVKLGHTIQIQEDWDKLPIDDNIISDLFSTTDVGYEDFLLFAIAKEKASFRFYVEMLPLVREQESREILLAMAEEEVKHKYRFEMEYEKLLKKRI
jgi:rubrerythrin